MKRELIVIIPFLFVLAALVWLNGRTDSEHFRWMLAASVVVFAAAASWRWRTWMWAPPLACGIALLVLFATFLTSPGAIATVFELFAGKVLAWYAIAVLAWFYARALLPRAREPSQGNGILALGGILTTALVVTSMACWLEAVDIVALRKNRVVTTSAGIKEQWERPWGSRRLGIFAVGRIAAGNMASRHHPGRMATPLMSMRREASEGRAMRLSGCRWVIRSAWRTVKRSRFRALTPSGRPATGRSADRDFGSAASELATLS